MADEDFLRRELASCERVSQMNADAHMAAEREARLAKQEAAMLGVAVETVIDGWRSRAASDRRFADTNAPDEFIRQSLHDSADNMDWFAEVLERAVKTVDANKETV